MEGEFSKSDKGIIKRAVLDYYETVMIGTKARTQCERIIEKCSDVKEITNFEQNETNV